MPINADQYKEILREHGRRVANRVAYASGAPANGPAAFHACYAPEHSLPEHERSHTPLLVHFDPMGFFDLYADTRWPNERAHQATTEPELHAAWHDVCAARKYGTGYRYEQIGEDSFALVKDGAKPSMPAP